MNKIGIVVDEIGINILNSINEQNSYFHSHSSLKDKNVDELMNEIFYHIISFSKKLDKREFQIVIALGNVIDKKGDKVKLRYSDEFIYFILKKKIDESEELFEFKIEIKLKDIVDAYVKNSELNKRTFYLWFGDSISGKLILESGKEFKSKNFDSLPIEELNFGKGILGVVYSYPMTKNKTFLASGIEINDIRDLIDIGRNNEDVRWIYDDWKDSMLQMLANVILFYSPDKIVIGGSPVNRMIFKEDKKRIKEELGKFLYLKHFEQIKFENVGYDIKKILNELIK